MLYKAGLGMKFHPENSLEWSAAIPVAVCNVPLQTPLHSARTPNAAGETPALPQMLAVLDCGGRDPALELPARPILPSIMNIPPKSGVVLRLPPHSKTLSRHFHFPS